MALSQLARLESEAIFILREAIAEAENPVLLYSIGKGSSVLLHLALKAFRPGSLPFPVLHIDTRWKFREMYAHRDETARRLGLNLLIHVNQEGVDKGIDPFAHGSAVHTDMMKTVALRQAIDQHGFDIAIGGARRDGEKSRAKERVFSIRSAHHRLDPKNQHPELWSLYNTRKNKDETLRVFPLSNWTELDVWHYIQAQGIPVVPLYFARHRPIVDREGAMIMVDDERMPLRSGESPAMRKVRFRTLGCYPLTGAVPSDADTVAAIIEEIAASRTYGRQGPDKGLLRFVACGSIDAGKSTLVGRLLSECGAISAAEREQGITLDVAYRYFSTASRKYIVADAPGHEQYTCNMITGASTADVAVILIDARQGMVTQTRRHAFLASLMGVSCLVFAINKMDLVDYSEIAFRRIEKDCTALAEKLGVTGFVSIPISALAGDNISVPSANMPWYAGGTLLGFLETALPGEDRLGELPFRLPVQWVNRLQPDFRGYAGTIASGSIAVGGRVRVLPAGRESTVARILSASGEAGEAGAGQAVTLTLRDEIDISRGDVISAAGAPAHVADQFEATVIWMDREPLLGGRRYLLKLGSTTVTATPASPKYVIDVNTHTHLAARKLEMNEIGVLNLSLDQAVAFDPYRENRSTGSFILIDRLSNATLGAGLLHFSLRRADNIHLQAIDVDKRTRGGQKAQKPCILWLTGLPGAGKSTIANLVDRRLFSDGRHAYVIDGDNVRHGLNRDLGFTAADRIENVRRVAEVAKLMMDAGLVVIVALISPFENERRMARELVLQDEFVEVFVDVPPALAEERDPKGLYKKARSGALHNFTGVDSPYERPENPEIHIDTSVTSAEQATELIVDYLERQVFSVSH